MLSNVHLYCFLLSYLVAFGLEVAGIARRITAARVAAMVFSVAGLVAQTAYLVNRSQQANLPPLLSSTQDWLLVLAWLTVLIFLTISTLERKLPLGLFLLPAVCLLIGIAFFADDDPHSLIADEALRRWGMLHAACLVVGTSGVLLGFVLSLMYLIQHRRLRNKLRGTPRIPLPSLEKLAALNWWAVVLAVPLLTVGLLAGVILGRLSARSTDAFRFSDPTVVAHAVVWVVMAGLFYRLLRKREPSGKTVAWQTIWAFGFLIVTIVGLELLTGDGRLDSFHSSISEPAATGGFS